jgi:predicted permease
MWLRGLLWLAAGRETRADVLADLADEYADRVQAEGQQAAARWYQRQLRRSVGPLFVRRLIIWEQRSAFDGLFRDLRFAVRSAAATPVFTISIVLLLGIGIGAHAVVDAVYDGLMLRPLPFGERSERLVSLHAVHPTLAADWRDSDMSYADVVDVRQTSGALEGLEAVIGRNISMTVGRDTDRVLAASMTPGLFTMMGVTPAKGRTFVDADAAEPGFESVAVISHAMWQARFDGRDDIVGQSLTINGRPLTVVGVMPRGFFFPGEHQLWLPLRGDATRGRQNRDFVAFGLIRSGVSLEAARTDLQAVARQLADRYPESNRDWSLHATPLRQFFVSNGRNEAALLSAVTLLLLVACANVAGLLVARGLTRRRELAVRAAMGASRGRLVRLLVLETMVLAGLGGLLGVGLAAGGIHALVAWVPEPPPYWAVPRFDGRVIGLAALLTAGVGLLAGVLPALRLSGGASPHGLLSGVRTAADVPAHRRLQRVLVAAQVAAGFALLAGASLLVGSGRALLTADGGFEADPLLSLRFYIAGDRYDPLEARASLVTEIVRRVSEIPGVDAAAATSSIPTDDGGASVRVLPPGAGADPGAEIGAQAMTASPDFWNALGLSPIDGRAFTLAEFADPTADVVVINARLADRFWPDGSAVGQTLRLVTNTPWVARVVGVVPNLVYEEFTEETPQSQLNVYIPYARVGWRSQALMVRASRMDGLAGLIRDEIRAIDPGLAVFDVMTMRDRRAYNHWGNVLIGQMFAGFAIATLLLAGIGAYGMAAFSVAQRRREIGVRLAVGATEHDVLRLFLAGGLWLVTSGAVFGLPLAFMTVRALETELFRVTPWTASIWVGPPLVLTFVVLLASYLPARRASRVDPVTVLRAE